MKPFGALSSMTITAANPWCGYNIMSVVNISEAVQAEM